MIWPILFAVALLAFAVCMIWKQKRRKPDQIDPVPVIEDPIPDEPVIITPEPDDPIIEEQKSTTADNTKVKTDNTNIKP